MAEYVISCYLDTRRNKTGYSKKKKGNSPPIKEAELENSGKEKLVYPLKLRVYFNYITRFYPTGLDLTEDDFKRSYLAERPRGEENKELKLRIQAIIGRAESIAKELKTFDFSKFEKKLLRPSSAVDDVFAYYEDVIKSLKSEDRLGTAATFVTSKKSLKDFLQSKGRNPDRLTFEQVTPQLLNDYERWMLGEGKRLTTVGIYLRPLKGIFNIAIQAGEVDRELYPFSKSKYVIPAGSNIKKALTKQDLKKLFTYPLPEGSSRDKARAFWFFSYQCNGINVKDICELKFKNVGKDTISFLRAKTWRTSKSNLKPIVAAMTPYLQEVINKYGNRSTSPDQYVFPILSNSMSATRKHTKVQIFTRFINLHMKALAKLAGVDENISTYYARHSFTTVSVQNGASLEFIQESLGHASISTTMNYWKGFEENVKKENANKLMDF